MCASLQLSVQRARRASSPSPSARRRRPKGIWSARASRCRRRARHRARRDRRRCRRPRCCRSRWSTPRARAARTSARRSGNSIVTEPGASSQTSFVAGAIIAPASAAGPSGRRGGARCPSAASIVARQFLAPGRRRCPAISTSSPLLQQRHVDQRDRRQAARREQRVAPAFERRDALFEREGRRRAVQPVGVAGLAAASRARASPRRSRKITVDALCTPTCTALEAGRRLRTDGGSVRSSARFGSVASLMSGQIGTPIRSWPCVATMRARANSPAFSVCRRLLAAAAAARVPSISGASA